MHLNLTPTPSKNNATFCHPGLSPRGIPVVMKVYGNEGIIPAETDECRDHPCKNGGVCTNGTKEYRCTCRDATSGLDCQYGK